MEYKPIGNTGIMVSPLCFGTMSFGGDADELISTAMFHRCREAGINFFDCADIYNNGMAEEILGRLISDCRDEVIITSKVYGPTGNDVNAKGANRKHIMLGIEKSLARLKTDYLDFYFIHNFDDNTGMKGLPLFMSRNSFSDLYDRIDSKSQLLFEGFVT